MQRYKYGEPNVASGVLCRKTSICLLAAEKHFVQIFSILPATRQGSAKSEALYITYLFVIPLMCPFADM